MRTALVIGFGPFPGAPRNPSADLVRALAKRRRPALAETRLVSAVLPTTYAAVEKNLPDLLRTHDPDVVLFFGLASRTNYVRVETRAVNAAMRVHPDAARRVFGLRPFLPGAPAELRVRAPMQRLLAAVRSAKVPARLSRDAGRYICNASLFAALNESRTSNRPPLAAFIHIPAPRGRLPLARRRKKRASLPSLVRAGEAALVTLLAAARRG
ncbi:MAG: pyroglutamyl-peptidase I [Bradyrhizobiaceae bacterium]|nr:pyroglutamyl-peptidase I [Bradyrhizobiaceae bacterium]